MKIEWKKLPPKAEKRVQVLMDKLKAEGEKEVNLTLTAYSINLAAYNEPVNQLYTSLVLRDFWSVEVIRLKDGKYQSYIKGCSKQEPRGIDTILKHLEQYLHI